MVVGKWEWAIGARLPTEWEGPTGQPSVSRVGGVRVIALVPNQTPLARHRLPRSRCAPSCALAKYSEVVITGSQV